MTTLRWKKEPGTPGVQAPISHGGKAHDYVISHRPKQHTVWYRPPGSHEHVGLFATERAARAAAEAHARGQTPKKFPAQLAREIKEILAKKQSRSPVSVMHARRKMRAPRTTPYRITLAPDERRALEFASGRYAWPDMLSGHLDEDGAVAFTESEMWQWTDDVDSDAEGGHSPFSLASGALAEKLQRFYDSRI
jgi:hypothetical protein